MYQLGTRSAQWALHLSVFLTQEARGSCNLISHSFPLSRLPLVSTSPRRIPDESWMKRDRFISSKPADVLNVKVSGAASAKVLQTKPRQRALRGKFRHAVPLEFSAKLYCGLVISASHVASECTPPKNKYQFDS